jgi:hypothetical protein
MKSVLHCELFFSKESLHRAARFFPGACSATLKLVSQINQNNQTRSCFTIRFAAAAAKTTT